MSGIIHEEMPFTATSFAETIRGSETFDGVLDNADRRATRQILNPEGTLIVVERDGVPVWSGIFWDPARPDKNSIGVHASGLSHYLEHINIDNTRVYANENLAQIVWDLMGDIAGKDDILPIVMGTMPVIATTTTVTFDALDFKSAAEALDSIALTSDGFDWGIEARWVDNPRTAEYDFSIAFPSRGSATGWILEYPGNVADYDMPVLGSRRASHVTVVGDGAGSLPFLAQANDNDIKPRMEVVRKTSDRMNQAALDALAEATLVSLKKEVVTITLQMTPGSEPDFSQIGPGDRARLRIRDGYYQFDGTVRVIGRTTTPGDAEMISLDVVDESAVSE